MPLLRIGRRQLALPKLMLVLSAFAAVSFLIESWNLSQSPSSIMDLSAPSLGPKCTTNGVHYQFNASLVCNDPAVSFLTIAPAASHNHHPKILCLVLTIPKNHATRMQAVVDTWGRKCDILVGASSVRDPSLHTYPIDSTEGYWGIFDKLLQTLRWIFTENRQDWDFDWILKADDDTYVIMENLHAFLNNLNSNESAVDLPLVYGRVMAWPRLKRFKQTWFEKGSPNFKFGRRFYAKLGSQETLRYAHGGPGYIMNRQYAKLLVDAYFNASGNSLKGAIAEDMGGAATMLYHGVHPRSTVDHATNRQRMHPETPQTMFENPTWLEKAHRGMKHQLKGRGEECCSPTSISYHYIAAYQMRLLEYQLYSCPRPVG
jgi:glycoprotein-N-acetylgalactosamine 3-beta-galactosyltransferase